MNMEDLAALAADLPEPPAARRFEAGWLVVEQLRAFSSEAEGPPSPFGQLTGIPIIARPDMHPSAWRILDADGNVLQEHAPEAGERAREQPVVFTPAGGVNVPCAHADAVPVESGGEVVAALCPGCDRQLPAAWLDCDHGQSPETIEITALSESRTRRLCLRCGVDYTEV